jgi:hypothetical protein
MKPDCLTITADSRDKFRYQLSIETHSEKKPAIRKNAIKCVDVS